MGKSPLQIPRLISVNICFILLNIVSNKMRYNDREHDICDRVGHCRI